MARSIWTICVVTLIVGLFGILTACQNPVQSDDKNEEDPEVNLTLTNLYGQTIDVYFGDWESRTVESSSMDLADDGSRLFGDVPVNDPVELWYAYNNGSNLVYIVDDNGDPYQFTFDTSKQYELNFKPDVVEYIIDGNAQFGVDDGGDTPDPAPTVNTPYISPSQTTYFGSVDVELSSTTTGASVYYTIDGSTPSAASILYTGPFTLENTATVKAVAELDGTTSEIAERTYTVYPDQGTVGTVEKVISISNRYFYAIDSENVQLHKFDAQNNTIAASYSLPSSGPVDMEYAPVSGMIFITSKFSSDVARFNTASETFETALAVSTVAGFEMAGIELDETSDRLYVTMKANSFGDHVLRILTLDGTSIAVPETVMKGPLMEYDPVNRYLFTGNTDRSPATIERWDVSTDSLADRYYNYSLGSNGQQIVVSEDGAHLAFLTGSGNGVGYTVYDNNPASDATASGEWLPAKYGEWNTGAYPEYSLFSPDSVYFYALSDFTDDQMAVYRVSNHTHVRDVTVPNVDSYARGAISDDGTVLVVFTYDDYSDTQHYFHVVTDIRE